MIAYTKRVEFDRRTRGEFERILNNRRGRIDHREYYNRVYIAGRPQRTAYPGFGKSGDQAKKENVKTKILLELAHIPCWRAHLLYVHGLCPTCVGVHGIPKDDYKITSLRNTLRYVYTCAQGICYPISESRRVRR